MPFLPVNLPVSCLFHRLCHGTWEGVGRSFSSTVYILRRLHFLASDKKSVFRREEGFGCRKIWIRIPVLNYLLQSLASY